MKPLESFKSTKSLFDYITKLLSAKDGNKTKEAGDLFEQFTREWHLEFNDYVAVYDANNIHQIPSHIIDKIDAWELLQKGANSFGIDKICVARQDGRIDVHQDKSTLHMDKKLGTDKAAKMMSLRDNPLKNIRHFVINTTAQDLSHYYRLWKDQTPLTYGYDKFVADPDDADAVGRDKMFWDNVRAKKLGRPTNNIFGFVSRGPEQDDYIQAGINYGRKTFQITGKPKWHQLGVGALGKSVLDPIILAELEDLFDPIYTKTPQPVSVSFYHSSKTLPKNGWEEVMRRRAKGLYDEVIVVSGTSVIEGENDNNLSTPFPKTINHINAVEKITQALENNRSVLLLTLYHHAEQIEQIHRQLNLIYPGFKFWYRKRDECDWPCSNADSSFAPALDDRTDSVITYGSSGTERLGKDPINDYGLNNINIHGPCAHNFTWAQAESAGLVKPLILIMPCVKESEVAQLFPEFVGQDGQVDWNMRVQGRPVDNTYPTAGLIADLVALAKSLVEYPEVKRLLTFSHRVKTNKLAEMNWPWICKKVLGNSNIERSVKKLFWQVLNDDAYNSSSIKDHTTAIKRAKAHDRYAIGSCLVFGRGYDDKFSPKHHAAIHFDAKTIVNTVQEIWRVTRTDLNAKTNKPHCGDPNAYYILPMRYNDLGDKPSFSEDRLEQLLGILQFNKNIFDEFESLVQNPNGSRRQQVRGTNGRIWIPEDFNPSLFGNLITWVAQKSQGRLVDNIVVEAHTWLLEQYLELDETNIDNVHVLSNINDKFYQQEKFQSIFALYKSAKNSPNEFRRDFFNGNYVFRTRSGSSQMTKDIIGKNILEFRQHRANCKQHRVNILARCEKEINARYSTWISPNQKWVNKKILAEEFKLQEHYLGKHISSPALKKLSANKSLLKANRRKVYKIMLDIADQCSGQIEWAEKTVENLELNGLSKQGVSNLFILRHFVRSDYFKVLTKQEWEAFLDVYQSVKKRQYTKVANIRESNISSEDLQNRIEKKIRTQFGNVKRWKTPLGQFYTQKEAADAYGISRGKMTYWFETKEGFEKL